MSKWDWLKKEMDDRFIEPYQSSYYTILYCKIGFNDKEEGGDYFTSQELRIQPGFKHEGVIQNESGEIYTDLLCCQNQKGEFFLIDNHPETHNLTELNLSNSDWLTWTELLEYLNNLETINYGDLNSKYRHDFSYIDDK